MPIINTRRIVANIVVLFQSILVSWRLTTLMAIKKIMTYATYKHYVIIATL
jgi:hypothetical protein